MYVRTPPGFEATNGHGAHAALGTADGVVVGAPRAEPALATAGVGGSGTPAGDSGGHTTTAARDVRADGHAVAGVGAGNGQTAHGSHGGDHLGEDEPPGPRRPWWQSSITADMPHEQRFPQFRVPWEITAALIVFLIGVFVIGVWPAPLMEALQSAGRALFLG
jgi:hypothetical protein